MSGSRVAIASTVVDSTSLPGFVAHHLATGFAHIFLFFDDPTDPAIAQWSGKANVTAIPCDPALRQRQRSLDAFQRLGRYQDQLLTRQVLNAEIALQWAHEQGYDWLLHLDPDDLFFCPDLIASELFRLLATRRIDDAVFLNDEAVPESLEVADPFQDVTLFKKNPALVMSLLLGIGSDQWPDGPGSYFCANALGRAACRTGPHRVVLGNSSFGSTVGPMVRVTVHTARILHYANCGFSRFQRQHTATGAHPVAWFEGSSLALPFHRIARSHMASGDIAGAEALYRRRVMIEPATAIAPLVRAGLLRRVRLADAHAVPALSVTQES